MACTHIGIHTEFTKCHLTMEFTQELGANAMNPKTCLPNI